MLGFKNNGIQVFGEKIVLTRPLNRIRLKKKLVPLLHSKTKEILITGSLRGPSISEYFLESLRRQLKLVEASWLHESDMIHIKKSKNIQLIIEVHNKNVQKKTKRIKFAR
ncbi:unnamed protein product [Lepeophtheirus salmonis]|uniref:(salmon louse) hypothetical protein n=1 Tax=Lepeophtheirus salmonis TaxID=72036 RepID=A0A7R8D6H3_LEPSM|nr:unnamed protein product [Lepeophtheirus salmonis]CAF3016082.1 unnamed protein product [Lepeophtheirus salmonis]